MWTRLGTNSGPHNVTQITTRHAERSETSELHRVGQIYRTRIATAVTTDVGFFAHGLITALRILECLTNLDLFCDLEIRKREPENNSGYVVWTRITFNSWIGRYWSIAVI